MDERFQVGDTVMVRYPLQCRYGVNANMRRLVGKIGRVTRVGRNMIRIDLDHGSNAWCSRSLKHINTGIVEINL